MNSCRTIGVAFFRYRADIALNSASPEAFSTWDENFV